MKPLNYDDMQIGQSCLAYIDSPNGQAIYVGIVNHCHGSGEGDLKDYEDFSLLFENDEHIFYWNEKDQHDSFYTTELFELTEDEHLTQLVLETV